MNVKNNDLTDKPFLSKVKTYEKAQQNNDVVNRIGKVLIGITVVTIAFVLAMIVLYIDILFATLAIVGCIFIIGMILEATN